MKNIPAQLPKLNNQRDLQDLLNLFPKDDLIRSSFEKRVVNFFAPGLLEQIAADQQEEDQPDAAGKSGVKKRSGVKFNVKPAAAVEPKLSNPPVIAPVEALSDYGGYTPLGVDEVQSQDAPVEAKPVEAVEAKPVTAKPVTAKPVEAKPVEAKTPDNDESSQKHAFVPKVDKKQSEKYSDKGVDVSLIIKKIDVVIETLNKINKSIGYLGVSQDGSSTPGIGIPDINIQRPGTVPVGGPGSPKPTPTNSPKQSIGSKAFNAIKGVGLKGLGMLGVAGAVAGGVYEGYTGWKDASVEAKSEVAAIDEKIKSGEITPEEGKKLQKNILEKEGEQKTSAVVGGTGAAGGALLGGAAGAALGTALFPGVGTVAGGLIGGTVGAIAGSDVGKTAGKYGTKAYNSITGFFSGDSKKAAKLEASGKISNAPKINSADATKNLLPITTNVSNTTNTASNVSNSKNIETQQDASKSVTVNDNVDVINFSQETLAKNDPATHQKFVTELNSKTKELTAEYIKTGEFGTSEIAKESAIIDAKTETIQKFSKEIVAAGAGEIENILPTDAVQPPQKVEAAQSSDRSSDTKTSVTSKETNLVTNNTQQPSAVGAKESSSQQPAVLGGTSITPKVESNAEPTIMPKLNTSNTYQSDNYILSKANTPNASLGAKQKQPMGVEIDNISKQNFDMSKANQTQIVQPIVTNTSTSTNTQSMVPIKAGVRYESSYSRLMDRNYMR